ncbi:hypothetical protein GCM10027203_46540 [Nonomuraea fastidiosa]|jgi:hypothetical protein
MCPPAYTVGRGGAEEPAAVDDAPQIDVEAPAPVRHGVIEERAGDRDTGIVQVNVRYPIFGDDFSREVFHLIAIRHVHSHGVSRTANILRNSVGRLLRRADVDIRADHPPAVRPLTAPATSWPPIGRTIQ